MIHNRAGAAVVCVGNNINDFATSNIYYVLNTDETIANLQCDSTLHKRAGHYVGDYRRMCVRDGTTKALSAGDGAFDDISDFDGYSLSSNNLYYQYKLQVNVGYISYPNTSTFIFNSTDVATSTISNIKRVAVKAISQIDNQPINNLYAYPTNIGTPRAYIKNQ